MEISPVGPLLMALALPGLISRNHQFLPSPQRVNLFFFLILFILRERGYIQVGEGQREEERIPSRLGARSQSQMWGSIPSTVRP